MQWCSFVDIAGDVGSLVIFPRTVLWRVRWFPPNKEKRMIVFFLCFVPDSKHGDAVKVHISQALQGYYAQWVCLIVIFETITRLILYGCFAVYVPLTFSATCPALLCMTVHILIAICIMHHFIYIVHTVATDKNTCAFLLTHQIILRLHVFFAKKWHTLSTFSLFHSSHYFLVHCNLSLCTPCCCFSSMVSTDQCRMWFLIYKLQWACYPQLLTSMMLPKCAGVESMPLV